MTSIGKSSPFNIPRDFQAYPDSLKEIIRIAQLPDPEITKWTRTSTNFDEPEAFTNEFQGLTHDERFWYFSCKDKIKKILWNPPGNSYGILDPPGTFHVRDLAYYKEGYNHFGAIDYRNGLIFVPVENDDKDGNLPLLLGLTTQLQLVATAVLTQNVEGTRGYAAWCAINPWNGYLYTSVNQTEGRLLVYDVSEFYSLLSKPEEWGKMIKREKIITKPNYHLYYADGTPDNIYSLAGGAFSTNGRLYLTTAHKIDWEGIIYNPHWENHLQSYNVLTGIRYSRMKVEHPDETTKLEELEGLTIWDLPVGNVHIAFLDNECTYDDEIDILHYRHPDATHPI